MLPLELQSVEAELRQIVFLFGLDDSCRKEMPPFWKKGRGVTYIWNQCLQIKTLQSSWNLDYGRIFIQITQFNAGKTPALYYECNLTLSRDGSLTHAFMSDELVDFVLPKIYCLGYERAVEQLEEKYGAVLSMHDKMELRREMPPELWPQRWREEL